MRYLFAKHPTIAERWKDETPDIKKLPEKKGYDIRPKKKDKK